MESMIYKGYVSQLCEGMWGSCRWIPLFRSLAADVTLQLSFGVLQKRRWQHNPNKSIWDSTGTKSYFQDLGGWIETYKFAPISRYSYSAWAGTTLICADWWMENVVVFYGLAELGRQRFSQSVYWVMLKCLLVFSLDGIVKSVLAHIL